MLPNIKSILTGQPLTGLAHRVSQQIAYVESTLAQQSAMLDMTLNQQMPLEAVPPMNQVPLDANKIAEGRPVAESIEMNGL